YDVNAHWVTWPAVGLRQPVVGAAQRQTSPWPYRGGIFGQMAEYEFVAALAGERARKNKAVAAFFSVGALSGEPIEDLTAWYEEQLSNEIKTGAPGVTLDEMKALPGAVWVDKKGTKYEKYAARSKPTLVVDPDGTVWDKPADDPKRKQQAIVVAGDPGTGPAAEGGVQGGRMIAGAGALSGGE